MSASLKEIDKLSGIASETIQESDSQTRVLRRLFEEEVFEELMATGQQNGYNYTNDP